MVLSRHPLRWKYFRHNESAITILPTDLQVPEAPPVGPVLGGVVGAGDEPGLAERQVQQVVAAERPERRPAVAALAPAPPSGRRESTWRPALAL